MISPRSISLAGLALLLAASAQAALPPESAATYEKQVVPFLTKHCYQCHGPDDGKAGLRLHLLGTDFAAGKNADLWKEVIDRINLGEMPPEDEPAPDPKEAFAVVQWVGRELVRVERESRMAGGRVLLRRLNRREYINTVRDLLALDGNFANTLVESLPADGKAEGFDRVSAALFVDATQMDAYLATAQLIASEAIVDGPEPETAKIAFEAEQSTRAEKDTKREAILGEQVHFPVGVLKHEVKKDGVLHIQSHYGYGKGPKVWGRFHNVDLGELVTQDGYYRIRIKAGASRGRRGEPIRLRLLYANETPVASETILPLDHPLENPGVVETVVFLRTGEPGQKRRLTLQWNGLPDVIGGNRTWYKTIKSPSRGITKEIAQAKKEGNEAALKELYEKRAEYLRRAREFNEPFFSYNEEYADHVDEIPKLFFDHFEISGPVHKTWPPESHQKLLGSSIPEEANLQVARDAFRRLLPRAFRRPVKSGEVERAVAVFENGLTQHDMTFLQAMRLGLQTVLCSPQFLYVSEPTDQKGPRPLNDYELASRLSYFLWSTMPDDDLFRLAEQGRLRDAKVLREQIERMLDDPRSEQLVESFAGQWLSVELFGSIQPANQYRDYDQALEEASQQEAHAFFAEILGHNLPITNFLDSDFLVINERLARHYGIEGVEGSHFRRVTIKSEHHRGGIFGMAGLMTLLSDGTRTLPVRRAAWIMENVFNDPPPPPPPNAGEIQPNTAGENLTVRQRLDRHRNEPTCASCHAQLDPFGLALENYDAIGAWRQKANGENFRAAKAPPLDVSGTLPSGRSFDDLKGFKSALLAEKDKFARAFSEKMLTYALSRPVGYVDRKTVDHCVAALRNNDYRLRSLIHAIVASEAFQTK